jgi:radical SAM-linked protein
MIVFQYSKIDGAEYLSHLDLLHHIDRTLRRAGIPIAYSQGYHPHPRIFLNNPLGTGIKSVAEYAAVETDWTGDFKQVFNCHAPRGVQCIRWDYAAKNPNFAAEIKSAQYRLEGVTPFDTEQFLTQTEILVDDQRGRPIDMRPRILSLAFEGKMLLAELSCGSENLRPDFLLGYLCKLYGGTGGEILKLSVAPAYPLTKE